MTIPPTHKRFSLGSLRQWHWVSSAVCLAALLLFAVTGFTLNHAGSIEATPRTTSVEIQLNETQLTALQESLNAEKVTAELKAIIRQLTSLRLSAGQQADIEWYEDELYLSLPRPGGDAWLSLEMYSEQLVYEQTSRGLIAYLNDLHKGRHTGVAWSWFIDLVALFCVIFALTGLWLLLRQQRTRRATWPLTTLGLLVPIVLLLLTNHS
ncbi:PepSY-associated TM helix domain-containing protein [Aliidiomarina sedimenti]|uniref:PepSY-associated TM helix domain-containing protein n=1 Tax=Aliidiomarina sedimenti TaxID=1933879 RepID=UPI001F53ED0B|nr:PepSY-associated TM helix domain-containing protein [Aliidiomarina sedimenti]